MRKSILVEITNKCNLRCKHCYNNKYLNNDDIDEEVFFNNIKILKENGYNHVHLLGGEPLMNKNIVSYILKLDGMGFSVTLNTNATLINDDFIKRAMPKIQQLSFSLDGVNADKNDEIRNKGTFDKVMQNISNIKNYETEIILNYVITSSNYEDIYKIADIADTLSIGFVNLLWFYEVENNSKLSPKEEQFGNIFEELENLLLYSSQKNICINFDLPPKVLEYFLNIGFIGKYVNKNNCKCFANDSNVYMNIKGEIYPCHPFYEKYEFAYDLRNGNYFEYYSTIKNILKNYIVEKDICQKCNFASNCLKCPIENKNIKLCKYIEQRCCKIRSNLINSNWDFSLNDNYKLIFENRIIDLNSGKIFTLSDEVLSIIQAKTLNHEITKWGSQELYGLIKRGVVYERLH